MLWAAAHPAENTVNIKIRMTVIGFRPNMSLSLAEMTIKAEPKNV